MVCHLINPPTCEAGSRVCSDFSAFLFKLGFLYYITPATDPKQGSQGPKGAIGPIWAQMGPKWAHMGPIWAPNGPTWGPWGPYGPQMGRGGRGQNAGRQESNPCMSPCPPGERCVRVPARLIPGGRSSRVRGGLDTNGPRGAPSPPTEGGSVPAHRGGLRPRPRRGAPSPPTEGGSDPETAQNKGPGTFPTSRLDSHRNFEPI